jgi:glucose/arabinose dehydrogenase
MFMRSATMKLPFVWQHFKIIFAALFFALMVLFLSSCEKSIDELPLTSADEMKKSSKDNSDKDEVDLKLIADNFVSPVGVVSAGNDDKRLFIIDQIGKIWIIDKDGNKLSTPFLDISAKLVTLNPNFDERGLLGLAFHPNYKHNGKFYVYYSAPRRTGGPAPGILWNNLARLSEFKVSSSNENMADVNSERFILEIDDPQGNHNGGTIAFGPKDDYLYIAIGDGGGANDTPVGHVPDWYLPNAGGNGQDVEANLFGNILRIDVDHGNPYGIPADNPFVGKPGLDEIYAYGLRNPYRFSFDSKGNHDLIAGDVGQLLYEEINVIKKGGNYGWNVKEGVSCFNAASSLNPFPNCPGVDNFRNPLIDPVIILNNFRNPVNPRTTAIVGGNIYRGSDLSHLKGKYIFGTFSQAPTTTNGELFIANPANSGTWSFKELILKSSPNDVGALIKGMGEDRKGELYITTSTVVGPAGVTGKVYKLVEVDDDDDDDDE